MKALTRRVSELEFLLEDEKDDSKDSFENVDNT